MCQCNKVWGRHISHNSANTQSSCLWTTEGPGSFLIALFLQHAQSILRLVRELRLQTKPEILCAFSVFAARPSPGPVSRPNCRWSLQAFVSLSPALTRVFTAARTLLRIHWALFLLPGDTIVSRIQCGGWRGGPLWCCPLPVFTLLASRLLPK